MNKTRKKMIATVTGGVIAASVMLTPFNVMARGIDTSPEYKSGIELKIPQLPSTGAVVTDSVYKELDTDMMKLPNYGWTKPQLVTNISPAIGTDTIRPDQDVVFTLNTQTPGFVKNALPMMIDKGLVGAQLLNGKTITPIGKDQIKYDSTTGNVTVQHPMLNRYTQYAVVLDLNPGQFGKNFDKGSTDVVTAVDTAARTITLLGKGVVSTSTGNVALDAINDKLGKNNYAIGDAVTVIDNKWTGKTLVNGKQNAVSSLFTTGSDLYEPTKVNIPAVDANPSVLADTGIIVTAADDYGLPAKASITTSVTEQGSRLTGSANLVDNPVELTDGSAKIVLSNHEAEPVQIRVEVGGSNGVKVAETQLQYQPGPTDKLEATAEPKYTVGADAVIEGTAKDVYDNPVKDGVQVQAASERGVVEGSPTNGGSFKIKYKPSTQKGNDLLKVSTSDSDKSLEKNVYNNPDSPVKASVVVPAMQSGKVAKLMGTVVDQHGNGTEDIPITLDGVEGSTITDQDGKFGIDFTPTANLKEIGVKAGGQGIKLVGSNGVEVDKMPVTVTLPITDYSGNTPPANVDAPIVFPTTGGEVTVNTGDAFDIPTAPYDTSKFVPFYYFSEFPVFNPSDFNKGVVTRSGDMMWLNQAPYGNAGTLNGLLFFRTTFEMKEAGYVTVSMPMADDAAMLYVDSKPIAYQNGINYTSGFKGQGIALPPASQQIWLETGIHSVIIESANAFTPGMTNGAGIIAHVAQGSKLLASSRYPATWTSTGYVTTPPTGWFFKTGKFTVAQSLLNFSTLGVGSSSKWDINVK